MGFTIWTLKTELSAYLDENLPMGPCVGGDVRQGACPHRAAPWRSCLGGCGAGAGLVVGPLGLQLCPAAAQSSRSSTRWGTPR